jgi:hypothetical protein
VKSAAQIIFTMKFHTALPVTAGTVKLYTCTAAGKPLQHLAEMYMQGDSAGSMYSASLALQDPEMSSISSKPGMLHFTVLLGAADAATGATAQLELLPGGSAVSALSL